LDTITGSHAIVFTHQRGCFIIENGIERIRSRCSRKSMQTGTAKR